MLVIVTNADFVLKDYVRQLVQCGGCQDLHDMGRRIEHKQVRNNIVHTKQHLVIENLTKITFKTNIDTPLYIVGSRTPPTSIIVSVSVNPIDCNCSIVQERVSFRILTLTYLGKIIS